MNEGETIFDYCCYCGERILFYPTTEHLVPRSKGGNNAPANRRPCCRGCNCDRGNEALVKWLDQILKKLANPYLNEAKKYKLEAQVENIKYWIDYVESAGVKLYRSIDLYNYYVHGVYDRKERA